jgi:hypothetical protein
MFFRVGVRDSSLARGLEKMRLKMGDAVLCVV